MPNDDEILNKDILSKVFHFFRPPQLAKVSEVSKLWKTVSEADSLWKPFLDADSPQQPDVSTKKQVIEQIKAAQIKQCQKELDLLLAQNSVNEIQKQNLAEEKLKILYLHGFIALEKFKNMSPAEQYILKSEKICNLIVNHYLDITQYLKTYYGYEQAKQASEFYLQMHNLMDFSELIIDLAKRFPTQKKKIVAEIQTFTLAEKNRLREDKKRQEYILASSDGITALMRIQEVKQDSDASFSIKSKLG